LATQNPKAEVLNTLIRGNMSTRIAFRVATTEHSRVILGQSGAQELPRTIRGRLVARLDRELETLQGLYITEKEIERLAGELRGGRPSLLTELEEEMVRHAMTHLSGKFHIHKLAAAFKGRIGMKRVWRLAKNWELRGWLIPGPSRADGRRVSDECCCPARQAACNCSSGGWSAGTMRLWSCARSTLATLPSADTLATPSCAVESLAD